MTREEELQHSINTIWTILDGDISIAEAMKIMGATDKEIKEAAIAVKKDKTGGLYNHATLEIKIAAYSYLKILKGIDITKIFNLTQHSFKAEAATSDIGIMDDQLYLYLRNGEWSKWH